MEDKCPYVPTENTPWPLRSDLCTSDRTIKPFPMVAQHLRRHTTSNRPTRLGSCSCNHHRIHYRCCGRALCSVSTIWHTVDVARLDLHPGVFRVAVERNDIVFVLEYRLGEVASQHRLHDLSFHPGRAGNVSWIISLCFCHGLLVVLQGPVVVVQSKNATNGQLLAQYMYAV